MKTKERFNSLLIFSCVIEVFACCDGQILVLGIQGVRVFDVLWKEYHKASANDEYVNYEQCSYVGLLYLITTTYYEQNPSAQYHSSPLTWIANHIGDLVSLRYRRQFRRWLHPLDLKEKLIVKIELNAIAQTRQTSSMRSLKADFMPSTIFWNKIRF